MHSTLIVKSAGALAAIALVAGCSSWNRMDHEDKGTTVGAGGGAVAGAVVGGPVGAVVGAGVGAYAGHEVAAKDNDRDRTAMANTGTTRGYSSSTVRSVQQALNDKGYSVGAADGQWGPATEDGVRRFQQSTGIPATGELNARTLSALGVSG